MKSLRVPVFVAMVLYFSEPMRATDCALQYNGATDFVAVLDAPDLDPPGDFTVEAWVKADLSPTAYYGFILSRNMGYTGWALLTTSYWHAPTIQVFNDDVDVTQFASSPAGLVQGRWQHIAARFEGDWLSIWVDGVLAAYPTYAPQPLTPSGTDLFIGSSLFGYYWKGSLDRVRIWSRALSGAEIRQGMWSDAFIPTGLVARWDFNECTGSTGADDSGNQHTAFLGTSPGYSGVTSPSWVVSDLPIWFNSGELGDLSDWSDAFP